MNLQDLQLIETTVRNGYSGQEAAQAEFMELSNRLTTVEGARDLLSLLEQSSDMLTVNFASGQLQQVFTQSVNSFPPPERKKLRQALLPILLNRVDWFCKITPGQPSLIALSGFSQLLARVWRICWFEIADNAEANSDSDSEDESNDPFWPTGAKSGGMGMGGGGGMGLAGSTSTMNGLGGGGGMNGNGEELDPLLHDVAKQMISDNPSLPSLVVGVSILASFVEEMGRPLPNLWPSAQRKTAVAFRDRCLFDIFKVGLNTMHKLLAAPNPMTEPAKSQQRALVMFTLDLMQRVFAFDFVGTQPDESGDEVGIIHIPSSWSSVFENPHTLETFLQFYTSYTGSEQSRALEIISNLVSVRSTVFGPPASQAVFLTGLFEAIGNIIDKRIGLEDAINRHVLCRLLVRLKCNFQLSQFIAVPSWKALVELIADFHITLMSSPDTTPSLLYYIMSWWSRLCSATAYLSSQAEPTHLQQIVPVIVQTLIESQLKLEEENPGSEDSLINDKQLTSILTTIPTLLDCAGRQEITLRLIELFNQYGEHFSRFNTYNASAQAPLELATVEKQLAFLVHTVTIVTIDRTTSMSASSGASSASSSSSTLPASLSQYSKLSIDAIAAAAEEPEISPVTQQEILDTELISCVFRLLQLHDERFGAHGVGGGSYDLEYGLACFLRQFASSYFPNEDVEQSKVHKALEGHGLETREAVLESILSKIAMNLRNWGNAGTEVSQETLQLFLAIVNGRVSSRLVAKSQLVQTLLRTHTDIELGPKGRNRREFYRVLGRIAFKDSDFDELYNFLKPFDDKFQNLRNQLQNAQPHQLGAVAQDLVLTLCDMRGALSSCSNSTGYENFFDWFYPAGYYETVCLAAIQRFFGGDWEAIWGVLRFVEEVVSNTHKRISFSSASPDGYRLFRDTANILIELADRILQLPKPPTRLRDPLDPAKTETDIRYKCILHFMRIFSRLLSGASDFANLGVFALFGDKIVSQLFAAACSVIFSMDIEEAQAYPKVIDVLYIALESICMNNITDLLSDELNAETDVLGSTLRVLKRGLRSKVVRIICCCAQSLDKLCTHQYNLMHKRRRPDTLPVNFTDAHIALLGEIMFDLWDLILLDHDMIHWTLCRPLFVLIQLLPDSFDHIRDILIKSQSMVPGRAETLVGLFKDLSNGIDPSMRSENREKFTQNALAFRNTCKPFLDFNALYKEMNIVDPNLVNAPTDGMS